MTLIVALKGKDGIVLAADSRGTYGDPRGVTAQNDSMVKLHQLGCHGGLLMAGDAGLGNQLLASFPPDRNNATSAPELMEMFRQHVRTQFGGWFQGFAVQQVQGSPLPVRPQVALVVAGYECDDQGAACNPVLYSLNSVYDFAPVRLDHGFALDGIAQYALYLFNRLYRDGYSMDRLKSLAAYAITETASQDGKVGGPIRMATISPNDGYQDIPSSEIDTIIAQNEKRSEALRRSFFGEDESGKRKRTNSSRKR